MFVLDEALTTEEIEGFREILSDFFNYDYEVVIKGDCIILK